MDTEENYQENYSNSNEGYEEEHQRQGEPMQDRENVIQSLYNTEKRISLLALAWSGNGSEELAGGKFIKKQMSALRAIINETNAFTRKTSDECREILYRSNEAFIKDMVNDRDIKRKDYRTLAKTFEHALELFLGLPEGGHGARVLNDALAGISTPIKEEKQTLDVKSWLRSQKK